MARTKTDDAKRVHRLQVMLTKAEIEQVEELAASKGLTTSTFARSLLLEQVNQAHPQR